MKSIWKGAINFGMVNIPVKLFPATQQSGLKLQLVDRKSAGKIRYKRINEDTGEEVPLENISKAYVIRGDEHQRIEAPLGQPAGRKKENEDREEEPVSRFTPGEMVILSASDFLKAEPEKNKIIEVNHFVDEKEINSIYFETSYYVEPELHGEKAYALLREALLKSGKVGVAQFVLRTSATLAVLKAMDDALVLSKIRFAEEIRSTEGLRLPPKSLVKPLELKMALTLIGQFSEPFDIKKYKDEYTQSLLQSIRDRASGKETKVRRIKEREKDDLIKQLKASLQRNRAS